MIPYRGHIMIQKMNLQDDATKSALYSSYSRISLHLSDAYISEMEGETKN